MDEKEEEVDFVEGDLVEYAGHIERGRRRFLREQNNDWVDIC